MRRLVNRLVCSLVTLLTCVSVVADRNQVKIIPLNSQQTLAWMQQSGNHSKFLNLIRYFVTQKTLAYCGVASSVILLNTLKSSAPLERVHYPYRYFTQSNVFGLNILKQGITPAKVNHSGMSIADVMALLSSHGLKTRAYHAGDMNYEQTKQVMVAAMKAPGEYILVNYYRPALHQVGGGHISPVAAYDAKTDSFLLLDVARYKYPPVWVDAKTLYAAMDTKDSRSTATRGFIVVHR